MNWNVKIKELRNKLYITQTELGMILGVSFSTVNRREMGIHAPTMKMKRRLSQLFKENNINEEASNEQETKSF